MTLSRSFLAGVAAASLFALVPPPLAAQVGKSVTVVDANAATEQQLLAITPLTPALVKSILTRRPFSSITELDALLGQTLSQEQRMAVYGRLFVHLNLNTAAREQILLIPNAGPRMVREFQEYRPYKALAQFHREIGKYVDDTELARLAQYVYVRIDLNTASEEAILSIPGVGERMLHEFLEYRPYTSMAQFRREIGKYVDEDEVERLARYVEIR